MDSSQQRKLLVAKRKRNGREREASRQIQLEGSTNKFSLEESPKKFKVDERVETPTCSTPRTLPQSRTNLNLSLRLKRIRESTGIPEEPRKSTEVNYHLKRDNLDSRLNTSTKNVQYGFNVQDRLTKANFSNKPEISKSTTIYYNAPKVNKPDSNITKPFQVDRIQCNSSFLQSRVNFNNMPSTITSRSNNEVQSVAPKAFENSFTCDFIQECRMNEFEEEAMDWSPIDQEELLEDIKKARMVLSQKQINTESFKWFNESIDNNLSSVNNNLSINYNNVFVVVDTNVFIDKLKIIINILQITYKDGTFPVIYVPWMVIQELDYFKEGYSTSSRHPISSQIQDRAKKAVKFINQMLLSRKPNFKGQSVREATDHLINTSNPDDAILSCCIQVAKCNDVILLSSDVNLRNKAIISDITSVPPEDIVRKLLDKKSVKSSVNYKQIILDKMSFICSYIMHIELKQFLGPQVYKLKNFQDPPWPYLECINYMKIYYMSILQNRVQKQCFKIITDLYATLKSNEEGNGQTLMELSLSLLVYLKVGLHKYSQNIQKVINELKTLDV